MQLFVIILLTTYNTHIMYTPISIKLVCIIVAV